MTIKTSCSYKNTTSCSYRNEKPAFSLVEVLISAALIAACIGAILTMAVGGKKTTEYEIRYLQALTIAEAISSELQMSAITDLAALPSEPEMRPLVEIDSAPPSTYALRLFQDRASILSKFPELADQLGNFQISVNLSSFDGLEENRAVKIIVYFRLSSADANWHKLTLNSLIAKHSPV
jgi:type II secretory pathway pseudopilin PulG